MKSVTRTTAAASLVVLAVFFGYMLLRGTGQSRQPRQTEQRVPDVHQYDTAETDWDDYLWPTNAGTVRTSDFAEFRRTHFHAGIDVSTGGHTGFDVYASRDGWLHSITFEPGGYGWFLVLRHPDGYYTCYAHLEGFADRVLTAYRARLAKLERSYGDARLDADDTIRVKKGEVIAYTGATGAGPAHLHFEIRDADYNPVNPGLSRNLRPADSIPPILKQLCITPLDASTSIDGKWEEMHANLRGAGSSFRLNAVPVIRGRAGIMLRAHDRANGATDYPTPYKITMFVDGRKEMSVVSNRFSDSLGFHIRIDRDHWLMKGRKGEFRKLYREEGNLLETYTPRGPDAGVLSAANLGSGEKRLLIIAEDLSGNRSMLSMTVIIVDDMQLAHSVEGSTLSLRTSGACSALVLEEKAKNGWQLMRQWDASESDEGVQLNIRRFNGKRIRAVTQDAHGNEMVQGIWSPGPLKRSAGRLYQKRSVFFDEIVYQLKVAAPFAAPPRVRIRQGERSEVGRVFPIDVDTYRAVLPTWPGFAGKAEISVDYRMGRKSVHWTDHIEGFHISARYGGQVRSDDGRFVLSFAAGDVFRSLLCSIDELAADSLRAWSVRPINMPIAGRPLASVIGGRRGSSRMLKADYPVKNYGIARIPHSPAVAGHFGRFLGTYRLLTDDEGPKISVAFALRSREPIRIALHDSVSGVDWTSIAVYIDKALVPVEYNERRNLLVVPYDVYKSIGKGTLTVRAKDRLGNTTAVKKRM